MKQFIKDFILRGLLAASGGPVILAIIYGIIGQTGAVSTLTPREVCLAILTITLLAFVVFSSLDLPNSWMAFIYAIPATAIVLLSLRSAWRDFRWNQTLISIIMWGCLLSVFMSLLVFHDLVVWKLFLLGVPGQAAILLWFRMFYSVPKEENNG